jgi:hypothetical protein
MAATTPLMNVLRRRLASCALALTVLQFVLLFAAPVSACCNAGAFRPQADAARVDNDVECCPPGSHPPGQCPRHPPSRRAQSGASAGQVQSSRAAANALARHAESSRATTCRMRCDAPHGPQFLLGVVGVIAAPRSTQIDLAEYALHAGAPFAATARPSLPDAPPPRLL